MTTVKAILDGARKWIGFQEGPNNDNTFGKHFGHNYEPYCNWFVSYVLIVEAKIKIASCGYVPTSYSYFKRIGKLFPTPKPGDLVYFDFNKDNIPEHIGFVKEVHNDGTITTIEANTSPTKKGSQDNGDGVYEKKRYLSSCIGFGRVV